MADIAYSANLADRQEFLLKLVKHGLWTDIHFGQTFRRSCMGKTLEKEYEEMNQQLTPRSALLQDPPRSTNPTNPSRITAEQPP